MIISEIIGGFGNQIFQYAHGYCLSKDLNCPLYLDTRLFKHYALRRFNLGLFPLDARFLNRSNCLKRIRNNSVYYVSPYFGYTKATMVREPSLAHHTIVPPAKALYLQGYWQTEKYFQKYAAELKTIFKAPEAALSEHFHAWKVKIDQGGNSVAVHIRRGDYIHNPETSRVHNVCTNDYYARAFEHIKKQIPDTSFFFFSDEIEWVKNNLKIPENSYFVSETKGLTDVDEFYLMNRCKNSVISNSTFSWWAAWLRQEEGLIIAPDKWFNIPEMNCIEIVPDRWTKIAH